MSPRYKLYPAVYKYLVSATKLSLRRHVSPCIHLYLDTSCSSGILVSGSWCKRGLSDVSWHTRHQACYKRLLLLHRRNNDHKLYSRLRHKAPQGVLPVNSILRPVLLKWNKIKHHILDVTNIILSSLYFSASRHHPYQYPLWKVMTGKAKGSIFYRWKKEQICLREKWVRWRLVRVMPTCGEVERRECCCRRWVESLEMYRRIGD